MTKVRAWLRDQRGFTLAELLVAVTIIAIILAGTFAVQRSGQETYLLGASRVESQQNARFALELMTRELRSGTSLTTITGTGGTDLTFVDQSGQTIRYAFTGAMLNRTINGTTTGLIGGVESFDMTYYSVYDVYNNTFTTTLTPGLVRVVRLRVLTRTEKSVGAGLAGDQHARMESTVMLRTALP